ncbi:unnamed protein product [Ixodes pacificus]
MANGLRAPSAKSCAPGPLAWFCNKLRPSLAGLVTGLPQICEFSNPKDVSGDSSLHKRTLFGFRNVKADAGVWRHVLNGAHHFRAFRLYEFLSVVCVLVQKCDSRVGCFSCAVDPGLRPLTSTNHIPGKRQIGEKSSPFLPCGTRRHLVSVGYSRRSVVARNSLHSDTPLRGGCP